MRHLLHHHVTSSAIWLDWLCILCIAGSLLVATTPAAMRPTGDLLPPLEEGGRSTAALACKHCGDRRHEQDI
jgi:hypothetical protein